MNDLLNSPPIKIDELVINWHLIEKCNYRCRYCFATWTGPQSGGHEVWRDQVQTEQLLRSLREFFDPDNAANPLRNQMRWNSVRLSLAGGEATLLGDRLIDIAKQANSLGFSVSLISNASLLDEPFMTELAPYISMLGLSLDSITPETNAIIGRSHHNCPSLSIDHVANIAKWARQANDNLAIKINTVVNKANAAEDLSELINSITPDRWKILRMLTIVTNELEITPSEFTSFVTRHRAHSAIMSVEDNAEMTQSYIMVDPHGRFFQNSPDSGSYAYSDPIGSVGPEAAFSQVTFEPARFEARYDLTNTKRVPT